MRILALVFMLLLLVLQCKLWLGEDGLREIWGLRRAIESQQTENRRLSDRNQGLAAEVADLKHGLEAVEERARSEMGMIKKGEIFYQIIDEQKQTAEPNHRP
ncbi:MAG: cell division protein FtsB [Gammaproteobacteria bacterium]